MQTVGLVVVRILAWAWALVAGVGGLALLIHEGPLPITNGWFAMFSGIAACPLTTSLLKKYAHATVPGYVQFAVALLIFVAGRVAVAVLLHGPILPQYLNFLGDPTMHEGSCHCGAVRLTLPATPEVATDCNCSLCRRIGGPWVYYEFGTVKVEGHPEGTSEYVWGDRTLRTIHCKTCGCVTHWEPLNPAPGAKHGVNLGNFEPSLLASVRVRRFDGADTWKFVDQVPHEL